MFGAQTRGPRLLSLRGGAGGSGAPPGGGAAQAGPVPGLGFWGAGARTGVFLLVARTFALRWSRGALVIF